MMVADEVSVCQMPSRSLCKPGLPAPSSPAAAASTARMATAWLLRAHQQSRYSTPMHLLAKPRTVQLGACVGESCQQSCQASCAMAWAATAPIRDRPGTTSSHRGSAPPGAVQKLSNLRKASTPAVGSAGHVSKPFLLDLCRTLTGCPCLCRTCRRSRRQLPCSAVGGPCAADGAAAPSAPKTA